MRDRIAIATAEPKDELGAERRLTAPLVGLAIWASVSPDVDKKIRQQVSAGIFPVKLAPAEWASGDTIWLLDVIAPTQKLSASVVGNFRQVLDAKDLSGSKMRLHPIIKRMLGDEALEKMGARPMTQSDTGAKPKETPAAKVKPKAVTASAKKRTVKSTTTKRAAKKPTVN